MNRRSVKNYYSIFGINLYIEVDDSKISSLIDLSIGYFKEAKKKGNSDQLTMKFSTSKEVLEKEERRVEKSLKPLFTFDKLLCYKVGEKLVFTDTMSFAIAEPKNGYIRGFISENTLQFPRFFSFVFFYIMLVELLRYRELYYVHAACVDKDGLSFLFPGDGGVGKTSVSLALIREGFFYLSDDSILLGKNGKRVKAYALPGEFHVDPKISRNFDELVEVESAVKYGVGPKRSFDPANYYPSQFKLESTPKFIFFPKITKKEKTELLPLTPSQSLAQLIPHSLLVMIDKSIAGFHMDVLRLLSKQCKSFFLLAGTDLLNESHEVVTLLLKKTKGYQ